MDLRAVAKWWIEDCRARLPLYEWEIVKGPRESVTIQATLIDYHVRRAVPNLLLTHYKGIWKDLLRLEADDAIDTLLRFSTRSPATADPQEGRCSLADRSSPS